MIQILGDILIQKIELVKAIHKFDLFLKIVISYRRIQHAFREEKYVEFRLALAAKDEFQGVYHLMNFEFCIDQIEVKSRHILKFDLITLIQSFNMNFDFPNQSFALIQLQIMDVVAFLK